MQLIAQLKASRQPSIVEHQYEAQMLKISTFNLLKVELQVVILVKYVASEHEAYWIFLKDIPTPNQNNETMTVRIPRTNKLSQINWESVKHHVSQVRSRKLAANGHF